MKKNRVRGEEIRVYMTAAEKNRLRRQADLEEKNMSEYLLAAGLSQQMDNSKMEFYLNINQDLISIKKSQLVITQLLLAVGSEKLPIDKKQMLEFYRDMVKDAEVKW